LSCEKLFFQLQMRLYVRTFSSSSWSSQRWFKSKEQIFIASAILCLKHCFKSRQC